MSRQPLYFIIPILAVIVALVLFLQRDNPDASVLTPSTTGSGAHLPPTTSADPAPGGSVSPIDRSTPPSATGRAPSGEPARPVERR